MGHRQKAAGPLAPNVPASNVLTGLPISEQKRVLRIEQQTQ